MKLFTYLLLIVPLSIIFSCNYNNPKITTQIKVSDQGVNLAYTDTGKSDTTLLFVHGWCINKSYWSNQSAYFANRYRVVAMDMPGFGQSGKNRSDWSTMDYGRDVDSVISQLKLNKVILIGHSMAGNIVLQAAIDNPEKVIGIVGVDNFKNVGHLQNAAEKKGFNDAIDTLKHRFHAMAFGYFNQDLFSATTSIAIKKRILNDVANVDTTIAVEAMGQYNDFDELAALKKLKIRLYLINSDIHLTDTTGLVKNKIPYQLLYIHGTGHFPMVENPTGFNSLLDKVIDEIRIEK
jgi:pimeloyl-ACP methyl ester carboxylesterase